MIGQGEGGLGSSHRMADRVSLAAWTCAQYVVHNHVASKPCSSHRGTLRMTNFVSVRLASAEFETQEVFWTGWKQVPGPVEPCHHVVPQPARWIRAANRVAPDTNHGLANENPQKPLPQLRVAARSGIAAICVTCVPEIGRKHVAMGSARVPVSYCPDGPAYWVEQAK
jgi:hypothetical protein